MFAFIFYPAHKPVPTIPGPLFSWPCVVYLTDSIDDGSDSLSGSIHHEVVTQLAEGHGGQASVLMLYSEGGSTLLCINRYEMPINSPFIGPRVQNVSRPFDMLAGS